MMQDQPADQPTRGQPPLRRFTRASARSRHRSADREYEKLCGLLNAIRVETQNLLTAIGRIRQAGNIADATARMAALDTALQQGASDYDYSAERICFHRQAIDKLLDQDVHLDCDYGDTVASIEDDWAKVTVSSAWPTSIGSPSLTFDEINARIAWISPFLQDIVYRCCTVTVPERVNCRLDTIRVGQTLNFGAEFEEELPDDGERQKILEYLQRHPLEVNGIVVLAEGVIYKVSRRASTQRLSAARVAIVVLLGFALVYLFSQLGSWLNLANWPVKPAQLQTLVAVYVFLLLGSFVHIVLDAYKQARTPGNAPLLVLGDWLLWINAKETPIIWGIVSLWIGFFGLVWAGGLDWPVAFMAGYSIDSVADLWLKRFVTTVQSGTTTLLSQFASATPVK